MKKDGERECAIYKVGEAIKPPDHGLEGDPSYLRTSPGRWATQILSRTRAARLLVPSPSWADTLELSPKISAKGVPIGISFMGTGRGATISNRPVTIMGCSCGLLLKCRSSESSTTASLPDCLGSQSGLLCLQGGEVLLGSHHCQIKEDIS